MVPEGKIVSSRSRVFFALVAFAFAAMLAQAAAAQSLVMGRTDFPTAQSSITMVSADFNGDGLPDFAVITNSSTTLTTSVSILLTKSDGSVGASVDYPVSSLGESLIVGDFNGDGKLDLAVTSGLTVSVLLGNGDGTFKTPLNSAALNTNPQGMAAKDLNGDGKLDLVIADSTAEVVSVLLGNGDGTFKARVDYPLGDTATAVDIADFNRDGKPDIAVVSGFSQTLSILLGKGDGTFQPHVDYPTAATPVQVTSADLNGDGFLDIVVANGYTPGAVSVYLGKGNGTFAPYVAYSAGTSVSSISLGDFNGDEKIDVAATSLNDNDVAILLGKGDGTFQAAVNYPTGFSPTSVSAQDFNGDGKLDLAILNSSVNNTNDNIASVMILLGRGDGTFHSNPSYPTAGSNPQQIVAADFNADGVPDLAITDLSQSAGLSVLLASGDGKFAPFVPYTTGISATAMAVGDFNGDKKPDLILTGMNAQNQNVLSVLPGKGDGTFQGHVDHVIPAVAYGLVVGDFNHDGKLDVVGALEGTNNVGIFLGNGNGTFASPVSYAVGNFPIAVVTGDFNGDGKLDIAAINKSDQTFSVLLGNGDGTFQKQVVYNLPGQPDAIVAADMNDDGKLDLVVATFASSTISVFLGNGDGTFPETPLSFSTNLSVDTMAAADFNGDGKMDLVIGSQPASMSLLFGKGDGTFYSESDVVLIQAPFTLAVADFNNDGTPDVAIPNLGLGNVSIFLSEPSLFAFPAHVAFAPQPVGTTSAPKTVTVTNAGAVPVTISKVSATGDFKASDTCSEPVKGGVLASCQIAVTFTPSAANARLGTLSIADDVPGNPQIISLSGVGTPPPITLSPASIAFGDQTVGVKSAAMPVTVTNTGTAAITSLSIAMTGANTTSIQQTNNCPTSLAAAAKCTINVTFDPTGTGLRTASVTLTDNLGTQNVPATGTGIAPPISLTPASLAFGNETVGVPAEKTVTVKNNGASAIAFTSITVTGANTVSFQQTHNCGASLGPSASCTINVTFNPTGSGARSASVTLVDSIGTQNVPLTGTGVAAPITLTPASIAFGNETVNVPVVKPVTVKNNQASAIAVTSITMTGANTVSFQQTNTCGTSISASGSCTINVTFKPTGTGARSASVTLVDSVGTQNVELTGTGIAAPITLSPTSLAFGNETVDVPASKQITVNNTGTSAITFSSIAMTGANTVSFQQTNTCGSGIPLSGSCTVTVTFKPTGTGARSASVTLTDNIGTQNVPLTGTGVAP
jgi:FG-GAP-like repeat/Abnormal spindle-like microcephaly-assoc'd, ASPM-SPD-2-Hydin